MLKPIIARLKQGHRTIPYPEGTPPPMPDRFRGRPIIDSAKCADGCRACIDACPTGAMAADTFPGVDLGRCLFCTDCADVCPRQAISHSQDYRLSTRRREDLTVRPEEELRLAEALDKKLKTMFGRSLRLRQVSAGGCNACEADVNVLGTIGWDIGRFGIQMVASPRHADGILVTGCVSENMRLALRKTYDAIPAPKLVIAVGACAISGGPFIGHSQQHDGAGSTVPIDLFIPGCPPHPLTILDGVLRLLGRLEESRK
ncbi:MAG: 4Fe-4S dicluster domain-containing protein [Candidatus Hydrogenedentales bacterium]|jgi:Ni,Fe-hydrogenase III small subunit/Pyruvate/2-oxoacid:ferredoxin oxidoreductase delta subunit